MKKLYKYISLVGSKLVGRRHPRDIDPPGMKELKNAFVSKSDSAITARPDFNVIEEDLPAFSDNFVWADEDNQDDYLNSAAGIYGLEDVVLFSKLAPIRIDDVDGEVITCKTYTTGTISGGAAQKTITGSGTSWKQEIWPGCFFHFAADSPAKYYKVATVVSNTECTVTANLEKTYAAETTYIAYKTHQPDHANYKLNIQPFSSGTIYSCPTIDNPIVPENICGPFHASTMSSSTSSDFTLYQDDTNINAQGYPGFGDTTANVGAQTIAGAGEYWMALRPAVSISNSKIGRAHV